MDCQGKAFAQSTLTLIKKRQWTWCQMALCREGHPTAKPASGAGHACISTRTAANAHSAGLPGHPPSAQGQPSMPVPSTRHEEVGWGRATADGGWATWVPPWLPRALLRVCEQGCPVRTSGTSASNEGRTRSRLGMHPAAMPSPPDSHFHSLRSESKLLQTFWKAMTMPTDH